MKIYIFKACTKKLSFLQQEIMQIFSFVCLLLKCPGNTSNEYIQYSYDTGAQARGKHERNGLTRVVTPFRIVT